MKATIRIVTAILGVAGLGIIVHEVLKKWQLIGPDRGILWTIVPLWALLALKEASTSPGFRMPPRLAGVLASVVNAFLIILAILALISIPFLWFGIIEDLARGGGASR